MTKHLALIVDDEPDICELLELTLNRMDINTIAAENLESAYQLLNTNQVSICLTDMRLPDGNGIELVKKIQDQFSHIPVAMISAHGNMDTAIEALKAGAFDFVSKPLELAELRNLVNSAIKLADKNQPDQLKTQANRTTQSLAKDKQLLGESAPMEQTRRMIEKLAKSQAPVYIRGESGTGKELAANQIHHLSSRSDKPFVPVNCGAIPAELMESEFFGHTKGSFTGASKDKQGLFQAANGGTLFLDEVADLPLSMQVKLLRAIQEKAIRPVGSQKEEKIDVRIISATHQNLKQLVDEGKFRQDLYYRINVIELPMPPLRERVEDIIPLAELFLQKLSFTDEPYTLSPDAIEMLRCHSFPGNVRELENVLERAVALCENQQITADDLSLHNGDIEIKPVEEPLAEATMLSEPTIKLQNNLQPPLQDEEQIKEALEKTRWNRKAAAELLGVTYRQLRYKLKKLGIE
jgi:two-component system response regulator PilR (NtrC family)